MELENEKFKNEKFGLGCIPSPIDIRDYKVCSAINPTVEYPDEFKLDNLPKVKNQGNINSCCAHATSSILEYYDHNNHTLSTNFIYGIQHKLFGRNNMGMYLVDACKIVQEYGDMVAEDCPGNIEIPNCWSEADVALKDENKKETAYNFKTVSYYLCEKDDDIKYALMNYGPVLAGMMWRNKYTLDKDNVINFSLNSSGGGHAVMIYGWNKKGWLIQNSWGEEFGDNGRFVLPFEYGVFEARVMIDDPELSGDKVLCAPHKDMPKWAVKLVNFIKNI